MGILTIAKVIGPVPNYPALSHYMVGARYNMTKCKMNHIILDHGDSKVCSLV